jgi:molecular chaperone GrpE
VSDAPRPEAPDDRAADRPEDQQATPHEEHAAPDAIGAWPSGDDEAGTMPAERPPSAPGTVPPPSETAQGEAGEHPEASEGPAEQPQPVPEDPRSREELLIALQEAEARRDEFLDDVRRARAEFENFRRRTMREGASQRDAGKAEVLEGMLDVLDDVDRTLEAAAASDDEHLAKGVQMVAEKLVRSLQGAGLQRVDATGEPFDPNQHEAVQQVEGDGSHEEPIVAQVLRPGYRMGERVLRAAMVVVEQ